MSETLQSLPFWTNVWPTFYDKFNEHRKIIHVFLVRQPQVAMMAIVYVYLYKIHAIAGKA